MTRSEFLTKAPGLLIPQPFAAGNGTSSHGKQFTDIWNTFSGHGTDVNFVDGFTSAFEAPSSQGGRHVKRREMNAIGHLASANWYKRLCGGVFQFDADMAVTIGGYPQGAVLEYLKGLNYYRVISLVDNNKVDYTGKEPTTAQLAAGITPGSVDGVNWAYCEQGYVSSAPIEPIDILTLGTYAQASHSGSFDIGTFVASRSGFISYTGEYSITDLTDPTNYGAVIRMYKEISSGVFGDPVIIFRAGTWWSESNPVVTRLVEGEVCRFTIDIAYCTFVGSGMKLILR